MTSATFDYLIRRVSDRKYFRAGIDKNGNDRFVSLASKGTQMILSDALSAAKAMAKVDIERYQVVHIETWEIVYVTGYGSPQ